jgi:natural product biosynthesis luciferase-like monooxygenase protein
LAERRLEKPLLSVLYGEKADPIIDQTSYAQVALFVVEYALASWWRSLGVEPAVLLGHSVGEIALAVIAGSMSLEDGVKLVTARGRLMQECRGKMAAVFADRDSVEEAIGADSREVSIAAVNASDHLVISGDEAGVSRVIERLERAGKLVRPLRVSAGFHSPMMDPILDRFREEAAQIAFRAPERAWVSNVCGAVHTSAPTADYWTRHIRQPVEFALGLRSAAELGATIFLEIGPGSTLVKLARTAVAERGGVSIASLVPGDEWKSAAKAAAELWTAGVEIDWEQFDRAHPRSRVRLPALPYERKRVWFEAPLDDGPRSRGGRRSIADRIRDRARETPSAIAAMFGDRSVSYGELTAGAADAASDPAAFIRVLIPSATHDLDRALVQRVFAGLERPARRGSSERRGWLAAGEPTAPEDLSALLYALACGDTIIFESALSSATRTRAARAEKQAMDFSLLYFAQEDSLFDDYQLLLDGARFADDNGFSTIWTPEHHFNDIGGPYANPSITSAAVAAVTKRVRVHGGTVLLPLHHPIRIAEEWAMVDRLSRGRAGIAFDSGLYPNDFVFVPDQYADRREILARNLDLIRRLWKGETVTMKNARDEDVPVEIHPRPVQPKMPVWLSCGCRDERYIMAGETDCNVITQIAAQRFDELAERTVLYRDARKRAGFEGNGHVTVMMHAFIGDDPNAVKDIVREPMTRQIRMSGMRMADLTKGREDEVKLDDEELDRFSRLAFEQYFEKNGLFGTVESMLPKVEAFREIGVNEIACLVDFGVPSDVVRTSFANLEKLFSAANPSRVRSSSPTDAGRTLEAVTRLFACGELSDALLAMAREKMPRAEIVEIALHRRQPELDTTVTPKPTKRAAAPSLQPSSAGPSNDTERALADIWAAVLRVPSVGVHDNFFDIGGDSRLTVEIVTRAKRAGLPLEPLQIFEHPTIAQLASIIGDSKPR